MREQSARASVVTGLIVIAVGVALLGRQLNWGPAWRIDHLWPWAFVVWGASRMVTDGMDGRWCTSGMWLTIVGVYFLLDDYHILRTWQSWPLFVIGAGLTVLMGGSRRRRRRDDGDEMSTGGAA